MKIWLVRHAKSSWADPGQADFDRPLNGRGHRDGPKMSEWLSRQSDPASWIWSSDARRALATADFVRAGFDLQANDVHEAHELYLARPETMLDVLKNTPPDIDSVAMVAHNPGTTDLLNALTGEGVTDNVPTFGVARLAAAGAWSDLRFGCCTLELYTAPKRLDAAP